MTLLKSDVTGHELPQSNSDILHKHPKPEQEEATLGRGGHSARQCHWLCRPIGNCLRFPFLLRYRPPSLLAPLFLISKDALNRLDPTGEGEREHKADIIGQCGVQSELDCSAFEGRGDTK